MSIPPTIRAIIKKCQRNANFFVSNFCKVKHPLAGVIPFNLFSYQEQCLDEFSKNQYNIFRKTRQCFREGSPVWTPNGIKRIEEISPGDHVYTYTPDFKFESIEVNDVFHNGVKDCLKIKTETDVSISCTSDHLLLTQRGWIEAHSLKSTDILLQASDLQDSAKFSVPNGRVKSVEEDKKYDVFDLSVSPTNNFLVNGIVVHNCGMSTLCGAYALWIAMFRNSCTVLIVSKRDEDAMNFLKKNVKFVYDHLPQWMKEVWPCPPGYYNQHKIEFPTNNSLISSLTSSPDTLRSNSSTLNIIDEAAFIPCMEDMWTAGFPCVIPSTLVNVDNKIMEIGSLGDLGGETWQDIDIKVQSDDGIRCSNKLRVNKVTPTFKIKTSLGYEIECTGNHRFKDENYDWIYTKNIKVGQKLALKCGNNFDSTSSLIPLKPTKAATILKMSYPIRTPRFLDKRLAELIGYYIGDGYLRADPKRFFLCCDPQDQDLYDYFKGYLQNLDLHTFDEFRNCKILRVNNSQFIEWLSCV